MKVPLSDLERWWILSLDFNGDAPYESIMNYAIRKLPTIEFAERAIDALAGNLHKCPAKYPVQFRKWCYKQIDRIAAALNKRDKALRRNTKTFRYEQHDDKCFIKLSWRGKTHIWTIPADWLEQARMLWPVYLRRYPDGRLYVARKVPVIQPDGSRVQKEVGVHRLFMGVGAVKHNFDDAGEVQSMDGSLLNFCNDNIRLVKGSDLLDHCGFLGKVASSVTADWKPAKRVLTTSEEGRSDRWDWHELSVRKWLGGGSHFSSTGGLGEDDSDPTAYEYEDAGDSEDRNEDFYE